MRQQTLLRPTKEVVFISGPHCSGKTSYVYHDKFSATHQRVCFSELMAQHAGTRDKEEIHRCITHLFSLLDKNIKVVIDDDALFGQREARVALVQKIKAHCDKTAGNECTVRAIIVSPQGGLLYCMWANEFALAERAYKHASDASNSQQTFGDDSQLLGDLLIGDGSSSKNYLPEGILGENFRSIDRYSLQRDYFAAAPVDAQKAPAAAAEPSNAASESSSEYSYPSVYDGFDSVTTITVPLYISRSSHELNHHGILLHAHDVFVYYREQRKFSFRPEHVEFLRFWLRIKKNPRIILLLDREACRRWLDIPASYINGTNFVRLLREAILELELGYPIYYLFSKASYSAATDIDRTCVVAYLQYLHSLNLRESMFITGPHSCDPIRYEDYFYLSSVHIDEAVKLAKGQADNDGAVLTALDYMLTASAKFPEFLRHMRCDDKYRLYMYASVKRYPLVEELGSDEDVSPDQAYLERYLASSDRVLGIAFYRDALERFEGKENNFEANRQLYQSLESLKQRKVQVEYAQVFAAEQEAYAQAQAQEKETDLIAYRARENRPLLLEDDDEPTAATTAAPAQQYEQAAASSTGAYAIPANDSLPTITMTSREIMEHFGATSFQRGRDYFKEGRVSNMKTKVVSQLAFKLYSEVLGSREEPYKQEALFKSGTLRKAICTCPIGEDGKCKHVAAQVLYYMAAFAKRQKALQGSAAASAATPAFIHVSALDPLREEWIIRVNVIKIHDVREWNNARSSGKIGVVVFRDALPYTHQDGAAAEEPAEIRAVMFNDCVDKFYDHFEKGATYTIQGGHVTQADPRFAGRAKSTTTCEIHLTERSIVKRAYALPPAPSRENYLQGAPSAAATREAFDERMDRERSRKRKRPEEEETEIAFPEEQASSTEEDHSVSKLIDIEDSVERGAPQPAALPAPASDPSSPPQSKKARLDWTAVRSPVPPAEVEAPVYQQYPATMDESDDGLEVIGEIRATTCPITGETMHVPYKNMHCGHCYEKDAILYYIHSKAHRKCPVIGCENSRMEESDLFFDEDLVHYIASRGNLIAPIQPRPSTTTVIDCSTSPQIDSSRAISADDLFADADIIEDDLHAEVEKSNAQAAEADQYLPEPPSPAILRYPPSPAILRYPPSPHVSPLSAQYIKRRESEGHDLLIFDISDDDINMEAPKCNVSTSPFAKPLPKAAATSVIDVDEDDDDCMIISSEEAMADSAARRQTQMEQEYSQLTAATAAKLGPAETIKIPSFITRSDSSSLDTLFFGGKEEPANNLKAASNAQSVLAPTRAEFLSPQVARQDPAPSSARSIEIIDEDEDMGTAAGAISDSLVEIPAPAPAASTPARSTGTRQVEAPASLEIIENIPSGKKLARLKDLL